MKIPKNLVNFIKKYSTDDSNIKGEFRIPINGEWNKKDIDLWESLGKAIPQAFTSFAKNCNGNKEDIDLLIILQSEYRRSLTWDHPDFHYVLEAGGFIGQKFDEIADYIYEKIIFKEKDEFDYKYFLAFCLTIAARTNTKATEYLWDLHKFRDTLSMEPNDREGYLSYWGYSYHFAEISQDVGRGLADSSKLFDNASPEVLKYLFQRMAKYGDPPTGILIKLNRILGNTPIEKCLTVNSDGSYSYVEEDLSSLAIPLICKPNLHKDFDFVYRWCNNDKRFYLRVIDKFNEDDTKISFIIAFLKNEVFTLR